jgi:hypothetical protein
LLAFQQTVDNAEPRFVGQGMEQAGGLPEVLDLTRWHEGNISMIIDMSRGELMGWKKPADDWKD